MRFRQTSKVNHKFTDQLLQQNDDLEQYFHRNSLLIYETPETPASPGEDVYSVILNLFNSRMNLQKKYNISDIDRAHPVA